MASHVPQFAAGIDDHLADADVFEGNCTMRVSPSRD